MLHVNGQSTTILQVIKPTDQNPPSWPITMARRITKRSKNDKSKKLVQSVLRIGKQSQTVSQCPDCFMTYSLDAVKDVATHEKYHDLHLRGRKWSSQWGNVVAEFPASNQTPPTSGSKIDEPVSSSNKPFTKTRVDNSFECIVAISPENKQEVRATLEIMKIVNDELRAPHDENSFWSGIQDPEQPKNEMKTNSQGRALVYVKNNRAIGAVTVEYLNAVENRGRWMVLDSSHIVPHVTPAVKVGISRIWVCRKQRGSGIATRLLEAAREHSILGTELAKWELAWSQPSESGAKLAKKYNSIFHHKSGKLIIPCYI